MAADTSNGCFRPQPMRQFFSPVGTCSQLLVPDDVFFFRSHVPRCVAPVPSIFFRQGVLFWVAADIEEIIIGEFIFERRCPRPVECCAAPMTSICDGSPEATSSQTSVDILTPSRLLHFRDSHVYKYKSQAEKSALKIFEHESFLILFKWYALLVQNKWKNCKLLPVSCHYFWK